MNGLPAITLYEMNYQEIKKYDTANGCGIRTTVWLSGCHFHCKGCFNHGAWSFTSGKPFDQAAKDLLFEHLADPHVKGLSILGGEPLQQDLNELKSLITEYHTRFPNKDLWMWTGYRLDELNEEQMAVAMMCDYIVDGRFEISQKKIGLRFRGSANQTIWENNGISFVRSQLND